jgi:hypothetical protein
VLQALDRFPEALARYQAALRIEPDRAMTHWYEGMTRLAMGDWAAGWHEAEWRWRQGEFKQMIESLPGCSWRGEEPVAGRTLLLFSEQGLGDTLQFVRYVPLLTERGARVVLWVQSSLKPLLAGMQGVEQVLAREETPPASDFHCPLMSLPLVFGTTAERVPADVPYLHASPERIETWRRRLALGPPRAGAAALLRVGLVWSGSRDHRDDHNRSIALERLLPLTALPRIEVVSLQKEVRASDRALLASSGMRHVGEALEDFADTAAVVSLLDLVVSVDTAVVHLAGALARPVWVLLPAKPEWRWMRGREDTPWYATARLLRQSRAGDWEGVIRRVQGELLRLVAERSGSPG